MSKIRLEVEFEDFAELMLFCIENNEIPVMKKWGSILQSKIDKMEQRDYYSKFKDKNLTPAEREKWRIQYLDSKGIPENFRW